MKSKGIMIGIIIIAAAIVVGTIVSFGYNGSNKEKKSISAAEFSEISPYDNTEQKKEAFKKLQGGIEPSKILSNDNTIEKYVGLSFQGLSDSVTNQKVLSLLHDYDRKATFFVPGIEAAECADDIADMVKSGNDVGSNSLNAVTHMEKMNTEELVNDFSAANNVIKALCGVKDPLLQCNATVYTEELLKAAHASGNSKTIYSTHFINYQSFTSYEQVLTYINKLPRGTILTIKLSGVLDEIEVEEQEVDERPAKDMQPTLDKNQMAFLELPEEDRIVTITKWILMALDETNYQTKPIKDFSVWDEKDETIIFDDSINMQGRDNDTIVYSYVPTEKNYVGIQIRGIGDEEKVEHVLEKLQETGEKATFYITAQEASDYPELVKKIIAAGCSIGNGGITQEILTDKSVEEIRESIKTCNQVLKDKFDVTTTYFMPAAGRYDDSVKEAAKQEQMVLVTYNKSPFIREGKTIEDTLESFKMTLSKGSLIYINLDTFVKSEEITLGVIPVIQNKKYSAGTIETLFANKGNEEQLRMASIEIPEMFSESEMASLKKKGGTEASQIQMVYTTERAVAFSFSGIGKGNALQNVLTGLDVMQAKGTFFVTYAEMKTYSARVSAIIKAGHEIGVELIPDDKTTFSAACNEIAAAQSYMKSRYGVTPVVVMSPMSRTKNKTAVSDLKKAVKAMNCKLMGSSVSIVQSGLKGVSTAAEYYNALTQSKFHIQMGQIIYTRLDYLDNPEILGEVLVRLKQDKIDPIAYYDAKLNQYMWNYEIKTVSSVLNNTADNGAKLYTLNSGEGAASTVNFTMYDFSDNTKLMDVVKTRYIGNPDVEDGSALVNFTEDEIKAIDKTGRMPGDTKDNKVFLSFDDWGTDASINHLLYVLNKYQIKATFFVISNRVSSNPNLLREIAVQGHEIGSHTATHFRLSNAVDTGKADTYKNDSLSGEEALILRNDLTTSYLQLYQVVGDVSVNGYPALAPIFRPPTLAVSKIGLQQVFETGFQYSISGDFSTQDYEYKKSDGGVDQLTNKLLNGTSYWGGTRKIQSHSIIVMHMSETSEVTADAIEAWMEKGARSKFNFDVPIYQYLTTH